MPLKKYQNRRLYGENVPGCKSGYVTLEQIRELLLKGEPVLRHPKQDDVTPEVLIALLDDDHRKGRGPTAAQLREFILLYSKDHPSEQAKKGAFRAWRGAPTPQKPDSTG